MVLTCRFVRSGDPWVLALLLGLSAFASVAVAAKDGVTGQHSEAHDDVEVVKVNAWQVAVEMAAEERSGVESWEGRTTASGPCASAYDAAGEDIDGFGACCGVHSGGCRGLAGARMHIHSSEDLGVVLEGAHEEQLGDGPEDALAHMDLADLIPCASYRYENPVASPDAAVGCEPSVGTSFHLGQAATPIGSGVVTARGHSRAGRGIAEAGRGVAASHFRPLHPHHHHHGSLGGLCVLVVHRATEH